MKNFIQLGGEGHDIRMFMRPDLQGTVEESVYKQAYNTAATTGVDHVCVLPDTHQGYGAPIGSVVTSKTRVIPGPVGFDIGCGIASYLTNLTAEAFQDKALRRMLVAAIDGEIAMGAGKNALHGIKLTEDLIEDVLNEGAYALVKRQIVPKDWAERCERPVHQIPNFSYDSDYKPRFTLEEIPERARRGFQQLGTLGSGNHFCEVQEIELPKDEALQAIAKQWGLFDKQLVFMVHSGSRGFGHGLGEWAFKEFKAENDRNHEPYTDPELVHADVNSPLARQYMRFVAAGANFALCNRLLMAKVIKEAIERVLIGSKVGLLYEISHNLAQWEPNEDGDLVLVHRKGTTRAFPAGHPMLKGTMWEATGHPVLTPGSMGDYSAIQVGLDGAAASFFSINHGAGRRMSRSAAKRLLDQGEVNRQLEEKGVVINQSNAPLDEAPAVYKPMDEVLASVVHCGLAAVVAKCHPLANLKGGDEPKKWK